MPTHRPSGKEASSFRPWQQGFAVSPMSSLLWEVQGSMGEEQCTVAKLRLMEDAAFFEASNHSVV